MFYWMRLFKSTAYFITLIFRTIADIKIFALMLVLIVLAFANFILILNQNVVNTDKPYVDKISGN
jgi:hypothetical protein